MTATIRRWTQAHRYNATVRQLRALSPSELDALGISPTQIERLAREASRPLGAAKVRESDLQPK